MVGAEKIIHCLKQEWIFLGVSTQMKIELYLKPLVLDLILKQQLLDLI